MDEIEKWRRLTNPTCIADYGLSVNLGKLLETDEGKEIYAAEIAPWMPPNAPSHRSDSAG